MLTMYFNLVVNGVVLGLVIGLAALALTLVYAVARFPNAATGDMITVGAYAGIGVQVLGSRNTLLQGSAAIAACTILSMAYYWFVFRYLRGRGMVALLLTSIGLALFTRGILSFFAGHEQFVFQIPLVEPYVIYGVIIQASDLWLAVVALLSVVATFAILFLTPIGRRMRAVADNRDLARASGIRAESVMIPLWGIVGAVSAIAGIILGIKTVVMPETGWLLLLPSFTAMILGGLGSPIGAVLAGIALGVAQEVASPFVGFTYKIAVSFLVLLVLLIVRPQGLFGSLEEVR
jgi:branched-chain amino acid transport system permease protein